MSELRTNRIVPRDGLPSGSYGGIIQVKYANYSASSQTISTTTYTDITGVSVTITPTRADSAILIMLTFNGNNNSNGRLRYQIVRTVGGSDTTLFMVQEALVDYGGSNIHVQGLGNNFVDTPSTTSAVTYKLQVSSHNGGAVAVNNNGRTDLIVMEIAS